jgi:hypothetical protein
LELRCTILRPDIPQALRYVIDEAVDDDFRCLDAGQETRTWKGGKVENRLSQIEKLVTSHFSLSNFLHPAFQEVGPYDLIMFMHSFKQEQVALISSLRINLSQILEIT